MKTISFPKNEIVKNLDNPKLISDHRIYSIAQRIRKKTINKFFASQPNIDESIKYNIEMFDRLIGLKKSNIFDFLNFDFASVFENKKPICVKLKNTNQNKGTKIAKEIINLTKHNKLNYFSLVVHGSQADGDATLFSDVDVSLFLNTNKIKSYDDLNDIYFQIDIINKKIAYHDPIGHHFAFINLSSDLESYPESFMPISVLNQGVLSEKSNIFFSKTRLDLDLLIDSFFNILNIMVNIVKNKNYNQAFGLKQLLSSYFMLIILEYEIVNEKYDDKKNIFQKKFLKYAQKDDLEIFKQASTIRNEWVDLGYKFIGVSETFVIKILEHSKRMCENIQNDQVLKKIKDTYLK